ncbi:MAG: FtsX-like permease family protein [Myxococcota bacterium]
MRLLLAISLRRLLAQPLRTSLVAAGIALGVAILCSFNLLRSEIDESFRKGIDAIAGKADLEISAGPTGVAEEALERVRRAPGVAHATPVLDTVANLVGGPAGDSVRVVGIDLLGDDYFFGDLLGDRSHDEAPVEDPLAFLNSTESVLVAEAFARKRGLGVGASFQVATPAGVRPLRVRGLLPMEGVADAYGGDVAVMDLYAMQIAFGREGRFDRVQVALEGEGASVDLRAAALRRALGGDLRVERPASRGERVARMLLGFRTALSFASGLALIVAMFLVYNAVSIAVAERRGEIGLLRALGGTLAQVRRLFVAEAALLGAVGGAAGAGLGVLLARLLAGNVGESVSSLYVRVQVGTIEARPGVLASSAAFGVVSSALAAILPARAAARVAPAEAVRRSPPRPETVRDGRLAVAGGCAFAASAALAPLPMVRDVPVGGLLSSLVLVLGFSLCAPIVLRLSAPALARVAERIAGLPGRLAAQNLARLPGRTAVTVSALGVAAALVISVGSFVVSIKTAVHQWIENSVRADLIVTASSPWLGTTNTPIPSAIADDVRRMPGVAAVDPLRSLHADVSGQRAVLFAHDVVTYERYGDPVYTAGDAETVVRELPRGAIAVSSNLAARRKLGVGDTLTLDTPAGARDFRIVAIFVDYTSDAGMVRFDIGVYRQVFGDSLIDAVDVYLVPGLPAGKVRALRDQILRRHPGHDLRVYTNRDLREISFGIVDQTFRVLGSLQLVALIVAILGVLNTLVAAVIDRTREIGMLRAVGATRRQVRVAVITEATLIGIGSSLIGVPAGLILHFIFTRYVNYQTSGFMFPYTIAWPAIAQATIGVGVVAALAGIYPARRAARLQPTAALRAE